MTQPNFLQVQNSLDRAVQFAVGHPDLESSALYGERLGAMRARFEAARRETDRMYNDWRTLRGQEMKLFRDLRLEYDIVAELADEHAYEDFPSRKIVYTEEAHLVSLIRETIAWLVEKGDEWDWLADKAGRLRAMLTRAEQRKRASVAVYQQYTGIVRRRVTGYADSVALLREYLAEVRSEIGAGPELAAMALDIR